jgi:hypothetical protein
MLRWQGVGKNGAFPKKAFIPKDFRSPFYLLLKAEITES